MPLCFHNHFILVRLYKDRLDPLLDGARQAIPDEFYIEALAYFQHRNQGKQVTQPHEELLRVLGAQKNGKRVPLAQQIANGQVSAELAEAFEEVSENFSKDPDKATYYRWYMTSPSAEEEIALEAAVIFDEAPGADKFATFHKLLSYYAEERNYKKGLLEKPPVRPDSFLVMGKGTVLSSPDKSAKEQVAPPEKTYSR